jgi:chromosome segregation ATPase
VGVTQGDGAVFGKRTGQNAEDTQELNPTLAAGETLRSAAESGKAGEKKDEEKMSIFWRVFGGTILSIVALTAITIYNNLSANISELRGELNREREARAALVKKDDFDTRLKTQYDRIRAVEAHKVDIEGLKERAAAKAAAIDGVKRDNTAALEAVKKDAAAAVEAVKRDASAALDAIRKDTAGLELLRERVAALEGLKKDLAALEVIKEKLAGLASDLKTAREDVARAHQELEKNKTYDLERKTFRDLQAKQVEDTIKELQKGIQDCREKLARLEGAQPVGPPAPKGPRPGPTGSEKGGDN